MRIYKFKGLEIESWLVYAAMITSIIAIMSGIVLAIFIGVDNYFYNFADIYIYNIFNFKNGSLFVDRFLSELLIFYAAFLLVRATGKRALALVFTSLRLMFAFFYIAVLFSSFYTEGALIALIVLLPCCAISVFLIAVCAFTCRGKLKPIAYALPCILAVASALCLLLIVNLPFRAIVVIF